LSERNWIYFDDSQLFGECTDKLTKALENDIEWIRKHTYFGEHAHRWDAVGRPGLHGLLLRPPVLEEAETWIKLRPRSAPDPTEAIVALIAASRAAYAEEKAREQARQAEIARSQMNLLAQLGDTDCVRLSQPCLPESCSGFHEKVHIRKITYVPSAAASSIP
jgi:hypothetical protein